MSAGLYPAFQFFDNNGEPLNGGLVYTYEPGTTTPKASYQDAALTTPQANPIVLSAFGRPPAPIWLNGETKVVVKTAADVTLDTVDNVNAGIAGLAGWATKQDGVILKSANYDLTAADDGKTLVATSGSWTLGTADAASIMGEGFVIDFLNAGSGVITLDPNGAETVNGESTASLGPGDGGRLVCDGSNWRLMQTRNVVRTGFKNRVINGDFSVDQRNSGVAMAFSTTNTYGPDRWFVGASTATNLAGCTEQVGNLNPGAVPNGPGIGWSVCRVLRNSGTYAGFLWLAQAIESANCIDMAEQTVTLSFKARRGSAFAGTLSAAIRSGTGVNEGRNGLSGGTWTNYIQEAANTWVLTTAWQRFSITATLQSGARELGVYFATSAYTGTGSANDYFDITDVQLEVGAAPTDFQRIPYQNTLEACQWYYQAGVFSSAGARYANSFGSWHLRDIEYTIPIRAANNPTLTGFAGSSCSTPALGSVTVRGFSIQVQTSAAAQYSATGNWAVDAEI